MSTWRRHTLRHSIRAQFTASILAGTTAASVALLTAMIALEASSVRRELLERTQVTARLVGEYCVPALAFDDLPGAQRVLARLGGFPAITHARLYGESGKEVATFDRSGADALGVGTLAAGHHRFAPGALEVHQEIVFDGTRYGTLLVSASTAELAARLRASIATAVLVLLGVLAASWLLARRLHRRLSRRVLALAATMERVTREQDFQVRAAEDGEDELAALGKGFNEMLERIRLHQAEREVAQARLARLGSAVEHAGEEVLITDASGFVQYVNPEFTRTTGFGAGEAIGRHLEWFSADGVGGPSSEEPWVTVRAGRTWSGRVRALRKEGQPLTEDATVSPIPGLAGEVLGFVVVRRDVTDRVRLERQLSQTQKMEALGTLAGGIAHDFNNILAGMIGLTELARTDVPRGSPVAANLEEVLKGGQRAAGLVRQILAFGRRSDEERRAVDAGEIVKEALELLRASLPTSVEIRGGIDPGLHVRATPTEIHQIVMNLCTNAGLAVRATGGSIRVDLTAFAVDDNFVLARPELRRGRYVLLTVADTGPGIDPAIRDRIFEPFFTTRPVGEGTGLGLSVVHGIVTGIGGAITVHSEPGKGALFSVYLPLFDGVERPDVKVAEPVRGGRERLLVVDDEPALVKVATRALTRYGYQVTGHTSSAAALEAFRSEPMAFDLMVTDLTMPSPSGVELAEALRKIRPELPIIICTGFGEGAGESRLRELGVDACVGKPYAAEELAAVVRRVLDSRR